MEGQFHTIYISQGIERSRTADFSQKEANQVAVPLPWTDVYMRPITETLWTVKFPLTTMPLCLCLAHFLLDLFQVLMVLECLGKIIIDAEIKESSECGGWGGLCALSRALAALKKISDHSPGEWQGPQQGGSAQIWGAPISSILPHSSSHIEHSGTE